MHVAMPVTLGFVEALASGKNEIRPREQIALQRDHRVRCAAEERKLVHVVIDAEIAFEIAREGERHRRVVPENPRHRGLASNQPLDQIVLFGDDILLGKPFGQDRNGDGYSLRTVAEFDLRQISRDLKTGSSMTRTS